jgi:hypothetical protein
VRNVDDKRQSWGSVKRLDRLGYRICMIKSNIAIKHPQARHEATANGMASKAG